LGIQQGDQMTLGTEGAGFVLDPGRPRQLGYQEVRNVVANLPQQVQFWRGWNFFIPATWRGSERHSSFFQKAVRSLCIFSAVDETKNSIGNHMPVALCSTIGCGICRYWLRS
jgi:hypothetical protein